MKCWHCNKELIWGGDHDIEEENEEKKNKLTQELKQLVMPGAMGEVFKVMALTKKQSVKLVGFKEQNLTERL